MRIVGQGRDAPLFAPLTPIIGNSSSAAAAIAALQARGPGLVVVLDAHGIDDETGTVLRQLVLDGTAPILGVTTDGPPAASLGWLVHHGYATAYRVPLLDAAGAEERVRRLLGGPCEPGLVARLLLDAGGSEVLLDAMVTNAMRTGALLERYGLWHLVDAIRPPDEQLTSLVEAGLSGLDPEQRDALYAIAVLGPASVSAVAPVVNERVLEALELLGHITVTVAADSEPTVAVSPPSVAAVLSQTMPALARRRVTRAAIDAATDTSGVHEAGEGGAAPAGIHVTRWRFVGGHPVLATDLCAAAAVHRAADDLLMARDLAERAAAQGDLGAALLLIETLEQLGDRARQRELLTAIQARAERERVDPFARAFLTVKQCEFSLWNDGDAAAATELVDRVDAELSATAAIDDAQATHLHVFRGFVHLFAGNVDVALRISSDVCARTDLPPAVVSDASMVRVASLSLSGQPRLAAELGAESFARRRALPNQLLLVGAETHLAALVLARDGAGQYENVDEQYREIEAQTALCTSPVAQAWLQLVRFRPAIATGDLEVAEDAATIAESLFRATGYGAPLRWALAARVVIASYRGNGKLAASRMAELDAVDHPGLAFLEPEVIGARAWAAETAGDHAAAIRLLLEAADLAESTGQRALEASALHHLVRIGESQRAAERLERVAGSVDSAYSELRIRHAHAAAGGDAKGLLDVATDFGSLGARLLAAEAAAQAASAYRTAGSKRAAADALRRSDEWNATVGARTPALHGSERPALTPREREVVDLTVRGLAAREVADELGISKRTVQNLLQHAYMKLGVSGRDGLSAALDLPGRR